MSVPSLLVTGGVRSGKSLFAEQWTLQQAPQQVYIATCRASDGSMAARIAMHKARRGASWSCVEESEHIVEVLRSLDTSSSVLVDCLGLWIAQLLEKNVSLAYFEAQVEALCQWIQQEQRPPVAFVSPECGLGLLPMSSLGRQYCDWLGMTNQRVAHACQSVAFVACGLPLWLK